MQKIYNKLEELEATAQNYWNITPDCGNFLNILVKSCNYKNIVEVGTSNGYSGIWLSLAAKETGGNIITVEFHQKRIDEAVANFEHCELDDVIKVRQGEAINVLNELKPTDFNSEEDRFIDFAFVDANKREYIEYYKILDKILKKGGMLVFDNIFSHSEKVADFTESITSNSSYQISFFEYGGGQLLAYRLD